MKKLFLGGLLFAATLGAQAQTATSIAESKIDPVLRHTIESRTRLERPVGGHMRLRVADDQAPISVIISVSDTEGVGSFLESLGAEATAINDGVMTATLTPEVVGKLAEQQAVSYIQQSRQFHPLMVNTRKAMKVNDIHDGKELETPYDGEGVLVAVIDEGFQPRHIAFYDEEGKTRVKQYWNRRNYANNKNTKPTTTLPTGGDGFNTGGHATHVTNIAAGSKVEGSNLYGIAPKSDLYLIPSTFDEAEMLEDIQTIYKYAQAHEQPVVVNMSLGSQMGPHDGSTVFDQGVSQMIDEGGLFVCAAMGNEGGQRIHATYAFKSEGDVRSLQYVANSGETLIPGEIWENTANGKRNVTFKPFYVVGGVKTYLTTTQMSQMYIYDNIDRYNNKHCMLFTVPVSTLQSIGGANARFGVEMTGNVGDTIHAWIEADYGYFQGGTGYVTGNSQYLVSEGGASIPHAFAIAAYATTNTFTSANGGVYGGSSTGQNVGDLAYFSSNGPWLGGINKPTIAAPGFMVLSALNSYDSNFDASDYTVTGKVTSGKTTYYYGEMSGTSMATPAATGVVALWLQANPKLTYADIMDIFENNSVHDNYAKAGWNAKFGYGKIDAYAGIKRALELAQTSIDPVMTNSSQPVTLQKGHDQWRILFNTDERFAEVTLVNAAGQVLSHQTYNDLRRGEERLLSLSGLPGGVYVVHIRTAGADITRKVLLP